MEIGLRRPLKRKMEVVKNQFGEIIDVIRRQKKMTVIDLTVDICSARQFTRYKSGEVHIPDEILLRFLERLHMDILQFYKRYQFHFESRRADLIEKLKWINEYKYQETYDYLQTLDEEYLHDYDLQIFKFLTIISEHHLGFTTKEHAKSLLKKLLDYPNCLNRDVFNLVEFNTIVNLIQLTTKQDELEELLVLVDKLSNLDSIEGFEWYNISLLNLSTIQALGMLDKFDDTLILIDKELERFSKRIEIKVLTNLFLHKLVALKSMKNETEFDGVAEQLLQIVSIEQNQNRIDFVAASIDEMKKEMQKK